TRIHADWQPTRHAVDTLRPETPNVDLQRETANFVDYWLAKPGKTAEKLDWLATWRKWMRTAQADIEARTARTEPTRGAYGAPQITKRMRNYAEAEAMKDNPDIRILEAAGIPIPEHARHLTVVDDGQQTLIA
ncbi:hypothetical protein CH289_07920, partial [Rhodococcus sp. RS1C4]